MQRFLIAGTNSGCGKTTVTCAVIAALRQRNVPVAAFKCGPDYIDPMFHREILGTPSYNLDSFFCSQEGLRRNLIQHTKEDQCAVIEGVMGFYDGNDSSAYMISEWTETPAILVIDCKGMKESIGAVMQGYLTYQTPNRIAGFIFNRLPQSLVPFVKALCRETGTRFFGSLPQHSHVFASRHLGLITATEQENLQETMLQLGKLAEESLCIDEMLAIQSAPIKTTLPSQQKTEGSPVIAVAKDEAFCFLYAENIELLESLGCKIRYFSPLADSQIPQADALLLCGGYPELHAKELCENRAMLSDVRRKIENGMPYIAECGGFMYLHETLKTESGMEYPMAGIIKGTSFPAGKLRRFGYITMHAKCDNLLCNQGETIQAHEFHYWDSTACGDGYTAVKPDGRTWECGHVSAHSYAGFPHLYFPSDPRIAERFKAAAVQYGGTNEPNQSNTAD